MKNASSLVKNMVSRLLAVVLLAMTVLSTTPSMAIVRLDTSNPLTSFSLEGIPQAIVPVIGVTPTLTPVDINASAGDQFDPHVSGDWAAYTSDIGLRYYNFATNTGAAIPMGSSANDLLSDISGSKIVFSRVTIGWGTAVMVFDAATAAAPIEVDPTPAPNRFGSAIGGNTVAYIDYGLQINGELVISDLSTSTSTRITNDAESGGNPQVSPDGSVVVWERCVSSLLNCDIWASREEQFGVERQRGVRHRQSGGQPGHQRDARRLRLVARGQR